MTGSLLIDKRRRSYKSLSHTPVTRVRTIENKEGNPSLRTCHEPSPTHHRSIAGTCTGGLDVGYIRAPHRQNRTTDSSAMRINAKGMGVKYFESGRRETITREIFTSPK